MTEEKKVVLDERRYAIITKDSVKMMAEASGHADISDAVAGILGEDVSYRLREITQKSAQFMRHAKRRRMNTEDFNKAARCSDIQAVHGHGTVEAPLPFRHTRDGDIHFVEDPDVNLSTAAFNGYMPKQLGDATIKAHWLAVEGVQKTSQHGQGTLGAPGSELSHTLAKYFDKITQAVLGSDSEMIKTTLADIRSNANISPLLPHFVNFISSGVRTVNHDVKKLTKFLHMTQSLVYNNSLFLEPQPFLSHLIQSVQYCLLESLPTPPTSAEEHWTMRDYAARLLAHIVSVWGNRVNHLERFTEKVLREVLYDHGKPYCSHYGAVMGLSQLGIESIERVLLPRLRVYWPHLSTGMEYHGLASATTQTDAYKVYGAIQLCVEYVMKSHINDFKDKYGIEEGRNSQSSVPSDGLSQSDAPCEKKQLKSSSSGIASVFDKSPLKFYDEMYEYFGDTLVARLPELLELKRLVFKPAAKEVNISLSDAESSKSGEQLLEELMDQIREDQISLKKRQRGKYVKLKQETDSQDQLERKRLEYERRMADHRVQRQLAFQRKQDQTQNDTDDEIDVEGGIIENPDRFGEVGNNVSLVKSTIGAPGQGIKLKFAKRPKLSYSYAQLSDSPLSDATEQSSSELQQGKGRKRRHEGRSPTQPQQGFDFEDISDYEATPTSYAQHMLYSSEGEGSSDGGSGRLKVKFRKRTNPTE